MAATVTELAATLDRPKSSVAYHVDVLVHVGLLQVVRTRKVRAVEERFYGVPVAPSSSATARRPKAPCAIAPEHADAFFERLAQLADEFTMLPRSGDTVFGLVAAVYRTDHPTLPEPS